MTALKKGKSQKMKGIVRWKILLLICIFLLIILPVLIWLSGTSYHSKKSSILIETGVTKNVTAQVTPLSTLTSYYGNSYIFSYPKGWTHIEQKLKNNTGTVLDMQPPTANLSSNPNITIEAVNAQLLPLSTMTQGFTVFNYKKTNLTVAGVPAQKYSAIIVTNEGALHSIVYVFTSQGKNYMIKLGYNQSATDLELESQFMQIVDNFKLN